MIFPKYEILLLFMRVLKFTFKWLDEVLFRSLMANPNLMPERWRKFLAMFYPDARIRKVYWESLGVLMGEGTYTNYGFMVVKNNEEISRIVIGRNVSIAPNVLVITDSSPNNSSVMHSISYISEHLIKCAPVIIEDDAWIGAGAIILPGVVVGKGAIVAAGAIVRDSVQSFTIVAGCPAKKIRVLSP